MNELPVIYRRGHRILHFGTFFADQAVRRSQKGSLEFYPTYEEFLMSPIAQFCVP
jgi:hypothetical protein